METEAGGVQPRRSRERWAAVALVSLAVLPLVVAMVYLYAARQHYLPGGDFALIELRTRDVFHHPVLIGPWSRVGWNHPGGLLYYALAAPYWLTGSSSIGLALAALLVNAVAIAGIGAVAWRRGRLPMVGATLVPVMLYIHASGWDVMSSPWNPYLPLLAFLLFVLLVWSVAVDDLWMMPLAIGLASFCVQSHVGFVIPVLALLGVPVIAVVARGLRTHGPERRSYGRRVAQVGAATAAVGLVLWIPVAVGDLRSDESNLWRLYAYFTSGRRVAGLPFGLDVMGTQWGLRPDWIFGARPTGYAGRVGVDERWWAALPIVLGLAATAVARWRKAWETVWLALIVGVALASGLLAVSRASGVVFGYLVRWSWMIGVVLGVLVLRGAWLAVPEARRAAAGRIAAPLVFGVVAVLAVLEVASVSGVTMPTSQLQQHRVERLTRRVLAALPEGDGPVMLDLRGGEQDAAGLALQLERRGIPVEVTEDEVSRYGPERARPAGPPRAALAFVNGTAPHPGTLVYRWVDPVTPRERRKEAREVAGLERAIGRPLTPQERAGAALKDKVASVYLVDP